MRISSSLNTKDEKTSRQSFKGFPVKNVVLPEVLGDVSKLIGNNIGTPEQKLIVATTASFLRPLIDLKYAEEDKKVDTAIKSTSKAIAGGLTGVTIRAFFISAANALIKFPGANYKPSKEIEVVKAKLEDGLKGVPGTTSASAKFKRGFFSDLLMPLSLERLNTESKVESMHRLRQYNNSLGGLIAVLVMAFYTNSKFDAPLTSDFQDIITGVVKEKKSVTKSVTDVAKKRYEIIKNWSTEKKNNINKFFRKSKAIIDIATNKTEV